MNQISLASPNPYPYPIHPYLSTLSNQFPPPGSIIAVIIPIIIPIHINASSLCTFERHK